MAIAKKLSGTSWHYERFERAEGDDKRHRSRCINYNAKNDGMCRFYCVRCFGSAHCDHYKEKTTAFTDERISQPVFLKPKLVSFEGVKNISIDDIRVDSKFLCKSPDKEKVEQLIQYYKMNRKMDKPIVVSIANNKYVLKDKYLRYYVAKKLNLREIPAEMGAPDQIKARDQLRTIGCRVLNTKNDSHGKVVKVDISSVTIMFDDEKEREYDVQICLKSGLIVPLYCT